MSEVCEKCNDESDDLRILYMKCTYDMNELEIPFTEETIKEGGINDGHPTSLHKFFTLRVCKNCRSDWMTMIKTWWDMPPYHKEYPGCGSGIFIRDFGANREITKEAWIKMYPDIEPVRVKNAD